MLCWGSAGRCVGAVPRGEGPAQGAVPRHRAQYPGTGRSTGEALWGAERGGPAPLAPPDGADTAAISWGGAGGQPQCVVLRVLFAPLLAAMSTGLYQSPMEVAVYQLHNFSISFFSSLLGGDVVSVKLDNR